MLNFERMVKPTRTYNELVGERIEKDRQLTKRKQNGKRCKQYQQIDVNAINDY
ncbi:hypothetical protein S14_221 [Shewanella sp. phage 1/4]|uniref:hypothetical protein n=1 Tax=Shewanella phage 1/4 TaxID=1458859 RepID=UPI0004F92447|nr:hypothetical protein S14_221 [Shewanella sp. phage 1/4]AHK11330.1 hypothetical protein S14_221 [Shewanella sp. phage 1/4]